MPDDKLNSLLWNTDSKVVSPEQSKKFNNTKKKINGFCKALSIETQRYDPKKTVDSINSYITLSNKLDRILYSQISSYVYSLDSFKRGIFATNIERLLLYSLDDENAVNEDCKKIIIKIYDHFQLILYQVENANNIFAESIEEAKDNLQSQIKSIEKEYITILGIFAAIVLTFVGGITFSTSVLQNISEASIFRLLLIVDFLAFVLINVVFILVKFIFTINMRVTRLFNIRALNIACLIIAGIIIISWIFNVDQIPYFISEFLPWSR